MHELCRRTWTEGIFSKLCRLPALNRSYAYGTASGINFHFRARLESTIQLTATKNTPMFEGVTTDRTFSKGTLLPPDRLFRDGRNLISWWSLFSFSVCFCMLTGLKVYLREVPFMWCVFAQLACPKPWHITAAAHTNTLDKICQIIPLLNSPGWLLAILKIVSKSLVEWPQNNHLFKNQSFGRLIGFRDSCFTLLALPDKFWPFRMWPGGAYENSIINKLTNSVLPVTGFKPCLRVVKSSSNLMSVRRAVVFGVRRGTRQVDMITLL